MFEETVSVVPSIWASVNSWFTPAVFFVLLNLMIGTIFVTSCFAPHPKPKQSTSPDNSDDEHEKQQQSRSQSNPEPDPFPSILERLKSINLYAYRSPEAPVEISLPIPAVKSSSPPPVGDEHEKQRQSQSQSKPKPHPSPSILDRLKSINLYAYESPEAPVEISLPIPAVKSSSSPPPPHPPSAAQSDSSEAGYAPFQSREGPEGEADGSRGDRTLDEVYGAVEGRRRVNRSQSDTRPVPGEVSVALSRKIKKSASEGSAFDHFEAEEGNTDDHEVDAKADDFINKFRQQLQLQRMESNTRYKELIMRGSDM